DRVGEFELAAQAVVVTTGGIGANHDIVRRYWPERLGTPPAEMVTGVPAYVDGRMLDISAEAGVRLVNRDRMWHYTEGLQNWDPIWPGHGIRILPGPSSMWFDALGRRLPEPCLPGYDTLSTLKYLRTTQDIAGYDHSWFILTQKIIEKEFALSGSEQNPDITAKDRKAFLRERVLGKGAPGPVAAFLRNGADFVTAPNLDQLVEKMNGLTDKPLLDPAAGPLIGVKLHVLTRKTLGGIQTDLDSRALGTDGQPIDGLYAAGEVAGFGGGGVHGYNALEGTFLGGCLFSGRAAGRAAARQTA
ncbi:FAD-binding protein, partial [Streptomyces sp. PSKA30]|uniref:FAD-binding protein n=1 Tax=Streptomyces sp. PSKA30 TaxID=2874597 RepID=UPI001CD16816